MAFVFDALSSEAEELESCIVGGFEALLPAVLPPPPPPPPMQPLWFSSSEEEQGAAMHHSALQEMLLVTPPAPAAVPKAVGGIFSLLMVSLVA